MKTTWASYDKPPRMTSHTDSTTCDNTALKVDAFGIVYKTSMKLYLRT